MMTIFKYEAKRLLLNRFFICLLIINGVFAWYTLTSDIIAGVAFTAPFSPWSFGFYLSTAMPMLTVTMLFLLTFFYGRKEKRVAILTSATPMDAIQYALVRNLAVSLGFLLLCVLVAGMALVFYTTLFGIRNYGAFIPPALVTIVPCFALMMGLGHCLGRIHAGFLYGLMLLSFSMLFLQIPGEFDLFAGGYYATMPLSLPAGPDGEVAFYLSPAFLAARIFYLAAGIVLFGMGIRPRGKGGRSMAKGGSSLRG